MSPTADAGSGAGAGSGRGHGALSRLGLGPRLFAAMALIVLAGAATLLVAALLVAQSAFADHLRGAGLPPLSRSVRDHLDQAFAQAVLLSLAVGIAVSILAAALVAWLVARRLAAPFTGLAAATARLADGHYDVLLPDPGLGPELAGLTAAVNQLAHRLGSSEETRRRLLADLAHELRTPLASLEATVEAITDGVLPVDATSLTTLADQSARLHRLVTDLESVSRAEERQLSLNPTPTALEAIARRAVAALAPRYASHAVTLRVDADPPGPIVRADADRLVEALMNLLDNALRHTPSGGRVTVTVDIGPAGDGTPGPARLAVTDTGEGFDPGLGPRLFERFFRGDQARTPPAASPGAPGRHGSGIGLTISRAIVRAHHGDITGVSAGPGQGATFTITLPLVANERAPRR